MRRLGDSEAAEDGRSIRDHVADALRQLGEAALADAMMAALDGDFARLKPYDGEYRAEIVEAPANSIRWRSATHPANALAEIHAVEALPRLRAILTNYCGRTPAGQVVADVIGKLESRASLPRAATAPDAPADTPPRAAGEPGPDTRTLPRGSRGPGE